ncbi:MAG: hypothetical protein PF588_10225 [Candidatus Kapabacteria bacterium]|jgi:hypothetical protein|nr:hypothetical protein [Candidatus Kapabacteria bacterium]
MLFIKNNIMKFTASLLMLSTVVLFSSCSDASEPENLATVNITTEMNSDGIQISLKESKEAFIQKSEVDSVHVSAVRILLSRIKFHQTKEADEEKNEDFKAGPFVFVGDESGAGFNMVSGQIAPGNYEKIKFEIHRFGPNETAQYANDDMFKGFATEERYTVVIEGTSFKGGDSVEFTYYGDPTANLSLKFEPALECTEDTESNIFLHVDPLDLFCSGESVADPMDSSNKNVIDNLIKSAIKAIKK